MTACPTRDTLRAVLAATLPAGEADTLDLHLRACPGCRAALDDLSDDPAVRAWRDGTPAAPPARPFPFLGPPKQPGDLGTLGTHRLDGVLGRGGMGVVFRGWDDALGRPVAVKVLRPEVDVPEARERFVREARAAAGLRHDHVVTVYGVFDPPVGLPYFTMELLPDPTLAGRVKDGPLPLREAAELIAQAADGLDAAHAAGLVHRDVKPANVLIDAAAGRAKVADFGLARDSALPAGLTQDGVIVGTPHYLSPEQAAAGRVDARTDVYGLGASLYEALTGTPPFLGTPLAVLQQVRTDAPAPPRRLNAAVPRDLEVVCLTAMARDPGRRYATAAALRDDLRRWLGGRPVVARPAGPAERGVLWARRNPLAVALLVVFLAGAVVSGWGWWRAGVKADEAAANADLATRREAEATASAEVARLREADADRARRLADDKAKLAEERAVLALGTIGTLVFKAQTLAGNTPGTLALRKQLAEAALADLRKLAAGNDRVPGADRFTVAAHVKLAETFTTLGQTDDALAQWGKAAELAGALVREEPADVGHRRDLATALVRTAYVHRRRADPAKAGELLARAVGELDEAARLAPADRGVARDLAVAHNARGDLQWEGGDSRQAVPSYLKALASVEALAAADPKSALYLNDLRFTHGRLALSYGILADFAAADRHQREAGAAAARALALDPDNPTARRNWHVSLLDRADGQTRLGDYAAAEGTSREALRHLAPVAAAEPDNGEAQRDLAVGHSILGLALLGTDRLDEAAAELEESLRLREKLRERSKGSALVASDLQVVINLLMATAERAGRYAAAARWCDRYIAEVSSLPGVKGLEAAHFVAGLEASKEAYAAAPRAVAEAGFIRTQKPAVAARLYWLRANALARAGRLADARATADEARAALPNDFAVLTYHARVYSYSAGRTADPAARAEQFDAALASLTEIARQRPDWFQHLALFPELVPVRGQPGFARCLEARTPPGKK